MEAHSSWLEAGAPARSCCCSACATPASPGENLEQHERCVAAVEVARACTERAATPKCAGCLRACAGWTRLQQASVAVVLSGWVCHRPVGLLLVACCSGMGRGAVPGKKGRCLPAAAGVEGGPQMGEPAPQSHIYGANVSLRLDSNAHMNSTTQQQSAP
eukprot:484140-Pelagomonas_calceolata.AAC.4